MVPPVFMTIDFVHFCCNVNLAKNQQMITPVKTDGLTGDEHCHHEIAGMSGKSLKKYVRKYAKPPRVRICDDERSLTEVELVAIRHQYDALKGIGNEQEEA